MRRAVAVLAALGAWVLMMGLVVHAAPAAAGSATFQYLDRFGSGTYNGNNGTDDFQGPWWENNDWGGPSNGFVTIESGGNCPGERCASISGDPASFWGTGIMRWAKTKDAANVQLSFRYSIDLHESTNGYLNVAVFDGNNWQLVHTIWLADFEDDRGGEVQNKQLDVSQYANVDFMVGFFAHDDWHADFFLDRVEVSGEWESGATTTSTTTTSSTTTPPSSSTTTTTSTTSPPATTTTTTAPPATTTTTTTNAPVTTTTTTRPPATPTTRVPGTTTVAPTTTLVALPPVTTVPPTTAVVVPVVPIEDDVRYNEKLALINAPLEGEIITLPAPEQEIVPPGPVTQIMASITTTAITVRSHLLSAMALGLLIAVAAIWGLGKREKLA